MDERLAKLTEAVKHRNAAYAAAVSAQQSAVGVAQEAWEAREAEWKALSEAENDLLAYLRDGK